MVTPAFLPRFQAGILPDASVNRCRIQRWTRLLPACNFLIAVIKIIAAAAGAQGCLMVLRHTRGEVFVMKSNFPFSPPPEKNVPPAASEEPLPPPSRFIDEKISDESGTESHADSALKPAGLNNPFWN